MLIRVCSWVTKAASMACMQLGGGSLCTGCVCVCVAVHDVWGDLHTGCHWNASSVGEETRQAAEGGLVAAMQGCGRLWEVVEPCAGLRWGLLPPCPWSFVSGRRDLRGASCVVWCLVCAGLVSSVLCHAVLRLFPVARAVGVKAHQGPMYGSSTVLHIVGHVAPMPGSGRGL